MTQQGEAEARGRAEPHKEGQRQHAGFRVRADKEGEAGAEASKTGPWRPGCTALERGERKVRCRKTSAPPATGRLSYYKLPGCGSMTGCCWNPNKAVFLKEPKCLEDSQEYHYGRGALGVCVGVGVGGSLLAFCLGLSGSLGIEPNAKCVVTC